MMVSGSADNRSRPPHGLWEATKRQRDEWKARALKAERELAELRASRGVEEAAAPHLQGDIKEGE